MTMHTPQYPGGRDTIVISNDITYQIGSFGPKEDLLFQVCVVVFVLYLCQYYMCVLQCRKLQRWHAKKACLVSTFLPIVVPG